VPIIYAAGNSAARKTGAWRSLRPVIDLAVCTRCQLCLAHCPEGVVTLNEKGYPEIDYDHCKGCMICVQECPLHCIHEEKEVRTW
jgi:pyruvate ferredoxin oxidoreductase gamma subunit